MTNYIIHRDYDYLEHHGIKGQKWGVRRYQNDDGSLTTAGKLRYLGESITGRYDPKGNNPYVSDRRKKNRLAEYEEAQQRKEKDQKRSQIRQDIKKQAQAEGEKSKRAAQESIKAMERSVNAKNKQNELKAEEKALAKHYVSGRVAANTALSFISSMAISAAADIGSYGKVDSGTLIRGALLGVASMPIAALRTGIETSAERRYAEKKYGLR